MTSAKLVTSPAEGHGLTDTITRRHFTAYVKGEPFEYFPALAMFKGHGQTSRDTAQGRHEAVQYEAVKIEPFSDPADRDDAMWKIQALYEARTSTGSQRVLPLGLPNEERRLALLERIEDWADKAGLTGAELEQKWRDHYAIGDDPEANYFGLPGDYRLGSVQYLLQFAIEIGAEPKPDQEDDESGDGDGGLVDDDAGAEADTE